MKVKVVGAGISGLLTAFYAVEKGFEVEVYEKADRAGGKISTVRGSHGLMETAANALLADAEVERVAKKIDLQLVAKKTSALKRYIYSQGRCRRWPLGWASTLRLIWFLVVLRCHRKSVEPYDQESIYDWCGRVLNHDIEAQLLSPGCQGIFGVTAQDLSASLIFSYFFGKEKKTRGDLRGSAAPQKGMGEWIQALQTHLKKNGVTFLFQADFKKQSDDKVLLCTDLPSAAELLSQWGDERASLLKNLPHVDLVSVNAFFAEKPKQQPEGFGILFVKDQKKEPLGVLFNNSIFPDRSFNSSHSETWIFGSLKEHFAAQSEDTFLQAVRKSREDLWGDSQEPIEWRLNRWPQAIPLYGLELERSLKQLKVWDGHVGLMGNYLGEIGLNRLFHRAKNLVNQL